MGLLRSLQTWDILLIYCNNQLKKYTAPLLRLARGTLSVPLLMSVSEAFSVPFYTLIKLCYTKAPEWSSLIPGPGVKSSLEDKSDTVHHKLSVGCHILVRGIVPIQGLSPPLLHCRPIFYCWAIGEALVPGSCSSKLGNSPLDFTNNLPCWRKTLVLLTSDWA